MLACGPGAVLSHRSAARFGASARVRSAGVDVTSRAAAGGGGARASSCTAHAFARDEMAVRDGIPVTTPARTLVDLADVLSQGALERALRRPTTCASTAPGSGRWAGPVTGGCRLCSPATPPAARERAPNWRISSWRSAPHTDCPGQRSTRSSGGTATLAETEALGKKLADRVGCANTLTAAPCLRLRAAEEIMTAANATVEIGQDGFGGGPSVDNFVLPASLFDIFESGFYNRMPLIYGTTANEFSWVILSFYKTPVVTDADYEQRVMSTFGPGLGPLVLQAYPSRDYRTPQHAIVAVWTDFVYTCPARLIGRALAKHQSRELWRYIYTHTFHSGPLTVFEAGHGYDDMMVWHNFPPSLFPLDQEELALATTMGRYWARLAASGDPNGGGDPTWDGYDPRQDNYLAFDTPIGEGAAYQAAQCDFWDPILLFNQ